VRETFPDLDAMGPEVAAADVSSLSDPAELDLIKRLAQFPRLVMGAAAAHEPHRLAFYLNDLAASFHSLWARGNESPHLRFIQPSDRKVTTARLALMRSCAQVVTSGLGILGVHAPSEMR
jgi:arginyl-tRNA synthetase